MTWHLYSSPRSPFVRKVLIAAHELGLEGRYSREDVVTTPMTPAPELAEVNPMGMIPTLVAEGEAIFDSLVIMEFMNDTASGQLFGTGADRCDVMTRHAMAAAAMDKSVRILDEQFRKQNEDTKAHLDGYIAAITRTIGWMEPRLDAARFDAGHICFAALLTYIDMRFPQILWRDGAKVAAKWIDAVSARPSMQATEFATPPFV